MYKSTNIFVLTYIFNCFFTLGMYYVKICGLFADQSQEFIFVHDRDAQFLRFLEFAGSHILSGKDKTGFF